MPSALFQRASREFREQAQGAFRRSGFGRMVADVRRAAATGKDIANPQLQRAMQRYRSHGPNAALREMFGLRAPGFFGGLERYAKGDPANARLLRELLQTLGPVGKLLSGLVSGRAKESDLEAAKDLIRSQGYEILPPSWRRKPETIKRPALAAAQFLRDLGIPISIPEEFEFLAEPSPAARPKPAPAAKPGKKGQVVIEMASGRHRLFAPDHPMVTGDMVPCSTSTNVHSVGYDADHGYLYVRFLSKHKGQEQSRGKGAVYRYSGVTPEEYLKLLSVVDEGGRELPGATSPGTFVWTYLRQEGTVSGHKKDYALVGVTGDYVPRKATFRQVSGTEFAEEYVPRQIRTTGGRWLKSRLPREEVGRFVRVSNGAPKRSSR